jgi:glucokinase
MSAHYLAIEIGGTKLQVALGVGDGRLLSLWRDRVDVEQGAEGIRKQLLDAVPSLLKSAKLVDADLWGCGVGFGGPVDDVTATVITSHHIEGWDHFPLADWISDIVNVPVVMGNDADVAGLGEATHGAGKGHSPIFYITVGTGVGGGLIINGEIYRGVGRGAAEIGHLRINSPQDMDDGEILPLESFASGSGIEATAHFAERIGAEVAVIRHHAGPGKPLTAKAVAAAAAQGDTIALGILDESLTALAEGISHVIALLCPRKIIIGGGVSLMGEKLFFEPLRAKAARRTFEPFAGLCEIVPAQLGEEVVLHGAIELARRRFGKQ